MATDPAIVTSFPPKGIEFLINSLNKANVDKHNYEQKLENASGEDIYKYVLLINVSALESYVAQARIQAQQSFNISKVTAFAGFAIVSVAIVLSIYLTVFGNKNLDAAYLAGISGVLTEFISGIFFFLYSKTLNQINLFHDKLVDMQKTALAHIAEYSTSPSSNTSGENSSA